MGQIISWSVRDESLHCEGIIKLFHTFVKERNCLTPAVKEAIIDQCQKVVRLEDAFIDLAFEMGPVNGMSAIADQQARLGEVDRSGSFFLTDVWRLEPDGQWRVCARYSSHPEPAGASSSALEGLGR